MYTHTHTHTHTYIYIYIYIYISRLCSVYRNILLMNMDIYIYIYIHTHNTFRRHVSVVFFFSEGALHLGIVSYLRY